MCDAAAVGIVDSKGLPSDLLKFDDLECLQTLNRSTKPNGCCWLSLVCQPSLTMNYHEMNITRNWTHKKSSFLRHSKYKNPAPVVGGSGDLQLMNSSRPCRWWFWCLIGSPLFSGWCLFHACCPVHGWMVVQWVGITILICSCAHRWFQGATIIKNPYSQWLSPVLITQPLHSIPTIMNRWYLAKQIVVDSYIWSSFINHYTHLLAIINSNHVFIWCCFV